MARYQLSARVSSANIAAVRGPLEKWVGAGGTVRAEGGEWAVEGTLVGPSARDLNRALLTELRRVEKRTRLRAEWTCGGVTERFFDYVPKGRRPASE